MEPNERPMKLYIRKGTSQDFERTKATGTYRDLVEIGQTVVGYGNFYIETAQAPSRTEQLLTTKQTKLQQKLTQLL